MAERNEVVALPANLESLTRVLDLVGGAVAAAGLPESRGDHLALAVEEAFVNICRYAYGGEGGAVEVRVGHQPGEVTVELADHGPPFDPLAAAEPDPDRPLAERAPGGMGLLLLRTITDDVRYRRETDRNVLGIVVRAQPRD
jgi:serine/threonine-protein kinase RsbW